MFGNLISEAIIVGGGCVLFKYLASRTLDYYLDISSFRDEEKIIDKDLRKLREINFRKNEINLHRNLVLDNDLEFRLSVYSRYVCDRYIDRNPLSDIRHISEDSREKYYLKLCVLRAIYNTTDDFKFQ